MYGLGGVFGWSKLGSGTIIGFEPVVGRVLGPAWLGVLESPEAFTNVAWHGEIAPAFDVVPFEGYAAIEFGFPIDGDNVLSFEYGGEVLGMFFAHILGCHMLKLLRRGGVI